MASIRAGAIKICGNLLSPVLLGRGRAKLHKYNDPSAEKLRSVFKTILTRKIPENEWLEIKK